MSDLIIFDTSVLVDHLRTGHHRRRIENLTGLIRNSAVVLAELWRGVVNGVVNGVANNDDQKFLRALRRNHPTLSPTENNWIESGKILASIRADRGYPSHKLRDLHSDVLIALTARSHGACLITSNRSDFETINTYRKFELEIW
jgi:predicted nucleic acid-binding protein